MSYYTHNNNKIQLPNLKLFINNEFVDSVNGKKHSITNPIDGKEICKVSEGDSADVDIAVKAAQNALDGKWGNITPEERGQFIYNLAELIEKNYDRFVHLESLDNGKPLFSAKEDITTCIRCLKYFAGWSDKIHGNTIPLGPQYTCMTKHEPVGVVALITPWNYPLMILIWKLAPALAAGVTIVAKPSENTPLTSLLLCELIQEAKFPPGVFNLIIGTGDGVGKPLSEHNDIAKVSFTGSTAVGKKIVQYSASNLKKVTLELGGKSPLIIYKDSDLDYASTVSLNALFANMGQSCCAGSRVFVHSEIYDAFLQIYTEKVKKLTIGDPFDDPFIGPLVSKVQQDRVLDYIQKGKDEGAKCHLGGSRYGDKGYYVQPTIFSDVKDHMTIAKEEIFGPVVCLFKFDTIDEVIKRANDTTYGLAAGICTKDISLAMNVSNRLKAGSVWINDWDIIGPATAFGGYKQSGYGKDLSMHAVEGYINIKNIVISHKTMFSQQVQ